MSLLDDVSIVVTPNGYKASKLYAVLPTAVEGSELITNGDFSNGNTGWNVGAGWSIANNKAVVDNASTTALTQSGLAVITGKKYNVSFEISDYVSGGFQFQFGGSQVVGSVNANGVYNFSAISTVNTTVLYLYATGDCELKVDNVTCKQDTGADMSVTRATAATRVDENGLLNYAEVLGSEVVVNGDFDTDSNWFKGANTTISGGKLNSNSAGVYIIAYQTGILTPNKVYKYEVTYTITSGSVRLGDSNAVWAGSLQSTSGTFTNIVTSSSSDTRLYFTSPGSDFVGSIDNVSVKIADLNNVPRIDYTGGGCPHILAEPQRTNLVTYSEAIGSNGFNPINSTIVANQTTSPDGTSNADLLKENTANDTHFMFKDFNLSNGQAYSISVFAKSNGVNRNLRLDGGGVGWSSNFSVNYDLTNGTTGSGGVIESFGNGWFRCSVTATTNATTSRLLVYSILNSTTSYQGDGSSGVFLYGLQLELGTYPTSYIPTSGSAVTRNKDQFTRDGISSLINSTEGVLFAEIEFLTFTGGDYLGLNDGSNTQRVLIERSGTNIRGNINSIQLASTLSSLNNKLAIKWKLNDFQMYLNGVKVSEITSGSVPSGLDRLQFEIGGGLGLYFFGKVKQLQVYKTALTDNQLIQLTGESGTHFFESYTEMAEALTYTIQ